MDETKALFKKVRGRDKSSFDALSDAYGWKLYSYIRSRTEDRAQADRIFSQTFSAFYQSLQYYDGDDPIEALLFSCADRIGIQKKEGEDVSPWSIGHEAGFALPNVDPQVYGKKKEPFLLKLFYVICILVLIVGILAAVWIMAWMLMSMNLIPQVDLGYSWFNLHIADLF